MTENFHQPLPRPSVRPLFRTQLRLKFMEGRAPKMVARFVGKGPGQTRKCNLAMTREAAVKTNVSLSLPRESLGVCGSGFPVHIVRNFRVGTLKRRHDGHYPLSVT